MINLTDREWILRAAKDDSEALIDGIKYLFNCQEADVDGEGDIHVANPMRSHWLSDDDLARVGQALRAGVI